MNTQNNTPLRGLAGLKAHFKEDLISGFSVSLIALPLCLGIAIASGVPPLAGLTTAIVGGMLASRISGSFITISGPAAGLIVITLGAVESLGGGAESGYAGYPHALGAILLGGAFVALFGLLKVGKVGDFFPRAAVRGMLAAIGIIIIIKQLYPALGITSPKGGILEVAIYIPKALQETNLYALAITGASLVILIGYGFVKNRLVKMIPAPMWVLIVTVPLGAIIGAEHLEMVEMPHNLLGEGGIEFPSFAKIGEGAFWIAVISFALVSGIESLLSAKAVDGLDPYERKSNLDQDLVAMGLGSSFASAIGGLPMISEIVRSSANINNGAKTQWSNFFHGGFLLIYLLIGTVVIEMIPTSALAAMLVFTGFRLASPKEFKNMFLVGLMELEVFIVTIIAVLATDLVVGIAIGILFKYVLLLFKGTKFKELFKADVKTEAENDHRRLMLFGSQIFSNYLSLKKKIDSALAGSHEITLDLMHVTFIDHTVMAHLEEYTRNANQEGKTVHIDNLNALSPVSSHPLAARDRKANSVDEEDDLSERTLQLMSFATKEKLHFQKILENHTDWGFKKLSARKKIIKIENIIYMHLEGFDFQIADMIMQKGAGIETVNESATILRMAGFEQLPSFYLHRTRLTDKIKESLGDADINFSEKPEFSERFVLRALPEQENAVRAFFTHDLIDWLNEHDEICLSSNGKALALYQEEKLLSINELKGLIAKAKEFHNIISNNLIKL